MSQKKSADCPVFNKLKIKKPKFRGLLAAQIRTNLMLVPIICAPVMSYIWLMGKQRKDTIARYHKCTDMQGMYCDMRDLGVLDISKPPE